MDRLRHPRRVRRIAIWIIVFYIIGAPSDEGEE
jgi:hypothetical protein